MIDFLKDGKLPSDQQQAKKAALQSPRMETGNRQWSLSNSKSISVAIQLWILLQERRWNPLQRTGLQLRKYKQLGSSLIWRGEWCNKNKLKTYCVVIAREFLMLQSAHNSCVWQLLVQSRMRWIPATAGQGKMLICILSLNILLLKFVVWMRIAVKGPFPQWHKK